MENNNPQTGSSSGGSGDAGIVFDTASGFSVDEQQEILNKINSLSVEKGIIPPDGQLRNEARKRGVIFPVLVNIAALLLLAGGFVLLWTFQSRGDQTIRLGSAPLGITERKLIQEIRKDTTNRLTEKEKQINDMMGRLADAGEEYKQLEQSMEDMNEEQKERAEYLQNLQAEYQDNLEQLQDERTAILEDSRIREAGLRTQADERAQNLSAQIEQSQASLGAANQELARLSTEQDRSAAAEAQLGVFYKTADSYINSGKFSEAQKLFITMEEFLNSQVFSGSRTMEARRQTHLAAVKTLEETAALIDVAGLQAAASNAASDAARRDQENAAMLDAAVTPLKSRITELEQAKDAQQRIIDILNSQDSTRTQIIAEYDSRINDQQNMIADLRDQLSNLAGVNLNQQQSLNQRDDTITDLKNQITSQDQKISQLNTAAAALEQRYSQLNAVSDAQGRQITQLNTEAASRDQQITGLNLGITSRDQQITQLNNINDQLQSHISEIGQSYDDLRSRVNIVPSAVEAAIENPNVQALLGPQARRDLLTIIQQAIAQAVQ
ncbi:MAG: hypothetical protein FWD78_07320 [Treponema sp.]|nr:hypothetical protein [Treponema sp.]